MTPRRYGITAQTIRNRLKSRNRPIRAFRSYYGQVSTRAHRAARMNWCRRHLGFRHSNWNTVTSTDKSRFNISYAGVRVSVCRMRGERFIGKCVLQRTGSRGGRVFVWGGILSGFKTRHCCSAW